MLNTELNLPTACPEDAFAARLQQVFHPTDHALWDLLQSSYRSLWRLGRAWQPRRIVGIGVRAGFFAFTLLDACPKAILIGFDRDGDELQEENHGGRRGLWTHAAEILPPERHVLILVDSHDICRLPDADLVYVDGDHSTAGCHSDLRLAALSTDRILVDDYDSIPDVRRACDAFAAEQSLFQGRALPGGSTGFYVFERKASHA